MWLTFHPALLSHIVNQHFDARDVVRTTSPHDRAVA